MENIDKQELIDQIKHLISVDGSVTHINPKYLEFFEDDELLSIKNELENKKKHHDSISNNYLDELYEKCK